MLEIAEISTLIFGRTAFLTKARANTGSHHGYRGFLNCEAASGPLQQSWLN